MFKFIEKIIKDFKAEEKRLAQKRNGVTVQPASPPRRQIKLQLKPRS